MKTLCWTVLVCGLWLGWCAASVSAGEAEVTSPSAEDEELAADWGDEDEEEPKATIRDPLEPVNRAFFHFNDKLYFWALKPMATGYGKVVPQPARTGVRNFFSNVATPIRLVNCVLQGKFKGAGTEVARFGINTTIGVAGLGDPAAKRFHLKKQREDFGQTLGVYRLGGGFYINWPLLGPSSVRGTVGLVGDSFLDPINYFFPDMPPNVGVKGYDRVNATSLSLGQYEDFKKAALDPYVALRDAYYQHRQHLIRGEE